MLIEETSQPGNIKLTGMVQDAQQNKLVVHPYTVRSDKLPEYTTDVNQLYDVLYNKAGVNGLFTDFPDKAIKSKLTTGWHLCAIRYHSSLKSVGYP